jgi:hypothetical protein
MGNESSTVCSPTTQFPATVPPQELRRTTLLQHIKVPLAWQDWMKANGLNTITSRFAPSCNLY